MTGLKNTAPQVLLDGRSVGAEAPPFLVAELSGNHKGDRGRALAMIEAAAEAGADGIKLQTYTADTITIDHEGPGFVIDGGLWDGRKLYDLYQEASTPWAWHEALFEKAHALGLVCFSSPFDHSAVDFLMSLDAPAFKIASFELVDLPLIRKAASTGKPLIMSTGMADLGEIGAALEAAQAAGAEQIVLLHCTSGYPTPPEDAHVRTIPHLAAAFGRPVGLSDHTPGLGVAVAAVALGAVMIEKHFTLARADGGPDAAFSMEPAEFAALVEACKIAHQSLGTVTYRRRASESGNAQFRRSLYVVRDLRAGERLTAEAVKSIRPGHGLAPKYWDQVLGRTVIRDIARGTPLSWDLISHQRGEADG